jgi:integrase
LRELKLLTHACNIAVKEWKWLHENPIKEITRPKEAPPRDRRISQEEIEKVLFACGYDYNETPETAISRVGAAFLFGIETAMRAGEIAALTWNLVDMTKQTARLLDTKNRTPRTVPLSTEAIRILKQLPAGDGRVFNLSSVQISSLFMKAKIRTGIEDLHFHDTRHEAITRLAKKLDVLALARMVGHRDLKMLMVYYNETAEELAKKLG